VTEDEGLCCVQKMWRSVKQLLAEVDVKSLGQHVSDNFCILFRKALCPIKEAVPCYCEEQSSQERVLRGSIPQHLKSHIVIKSDISHLAD
jgi:hypothetical protein